jgi:hypothetical protein
MKVDKVEYYWLTNRVRELEAELREFMAAASDVLHVDYCCERDQTYHDIDNAQRRLCRAYMKTADRMNRDAERKQS